MDHNFLSALILLLLVLDPFGALPVFISVMGTVAPERRTRVALRESAIAFVILLVIALRMIFGRGDAVGVAAAPATEPLVFPLAVPLLAGPSAMATVLLLASRQPDRLGVWVAALALAMVVSCVVLLLADRLRRWLGTSVVAAIEKLMGLLLTAVAMEMILSGLKRYFLGGD